MGKKQEQADHKVNRIVELTSDNIEKFVRDITEDNKMLCKNDEERSRVEEALKGIFYDADGSEEKIEVESDSGWIQDKRKATLYWRDSKVHICAKETVLDFIKYAFSREGWEPVVDAYQTIGTQQVDVETVLGIVSIILFLQKHIRERIVHLDDNNYCIYLQIITHYKEHKPVTPDEVFAWIPENGDSCNLRNTTWRCPDCKEEKCFYKDKKDVPKVKEQMEKMVQEKLLVREKNNVYKINF